MNVRDLAERLGWTALSAALAAVGLELTHLDTSIWWVPIAVTAVNAATIVLRRATPLPNPGEGLPGLPTGRGPHV